MRALAALLVSAALVTGCGKGTSDDDTDLPADTEVALDTEIGAADAERCEQACTALIGCDVGLTLQDCTASCTAPSGAAYRACLSTTDPTSCDAAASCFFQSACGYDDVPQGDLTCQESQECGATCIGNPDPQCACDCDQVTDPAVLIDLYRLFVCWTGSCAVECGTAGNPVACDACLDDRCAAEDATCD